MITFSRLFSPLLILVALSIVTMNGQAPQPIIVQAASPAPPASTTTSPPPLVPISASTTAAIKLLQDLKAVNGETLKKQQTALEQLDELQKAADEIKIFASRG